MRATRWAASWVGGVIGALLAVPDAVPAERPAPPGVEASAVPCSSDRDLTARLASIRTMRADFREEKTLALLDEPLVTEGRIEYVKPDRLRQTILRPGRQTVSLAGGRLRVVQHDLDHEERMDLDRNPMARAIVQSILLVMSGQVQSLADQYRCTLTRVPSGEARLDLLPLKEPLDRIVRSMTVLVGADGKIREVRIEEKGGDSSRMTFTHVEYDRPLTLDD